MTDAIKTLNNIRTLRAQARETDLATLEEMLEKLTAIVEDRRQEESLALQQNAERQAKIEALRAQLLEDGIDPSELLAILNLPVRLLFVLLVLLNTSTLMKMVMKRRGRVKVVHQKRLLLHWKVVKLLKTLPSEFGCDLLPRMAVKIDYRALWDLVNSSPA
jgi:hypothetical protein